MSFSSLEQAQSALSLYLGLSGTGDVPSVFRGSDYVPRPLKRGAAFLDKGIVAALLGNVDGSWIAIVRDGQSVLFLDERGQKQGAVAPSDLSKVVEGWLIKRRSEALLTAASFYKQHKRPLLQILATGLFVNFFGLSLPVFSSFVYDKVLGNGLYETLWALTIGLLIVAGFDLAMRQLRLLIAERFALETEAELDRSVMQQLLRARGKALPSVGQFLDRYKRLLGTRDFMSSSYLLSVVDVPFILLYLGVVACAAGWLVLVPLGMGMGMVLANFLTSRAVRAYDVVSRRDEEQKFRLLVDILGAHETIIGGSWRAQIAARWRTVCAEVSSSQSLMRFWRSTGQSLSALFSFVGYAGVIVGGVYMVEAQTLTSGGLLAASMLSSRAMASFSSISTLLLRFDEFRTALYEINELFGSEAKTDKQRCAIRGAIEFQNITCRMGESSTPVLEKLSFRIEAGETVGIAGAPGAGKTTLLRLIAGINVADEGRVLIDHYPVEELAPQTIAEAIGYKAQEPCLISGSVEDNVVAGRAAMSIEERERILSATGLGWVFQNTGMNWLTDVGGRGLSLSGGQRQLVALARVLLRPHAVMLLDEPTNGLDAQLEAHLAKELLARKGQSTMIISTHSRHLLSVCDRIIVVGQGRALADGPRDKILVV